MHYIAIIHKTQICIFLKTIKDQQENFIMWDNIAFIINNLPVSNRLILFDGTKTHWINFFTSPEKNYIESSRGHFHTKEIKFIEINPIEIKHIGNLIPDIVINHSKELDRALKSLEIEYLKQEDIYCIIPERKMIISVDTYTFILNWMENTYIEQVISNNFEGGILNWRKNLNFNLISMRENEKNLFLTNLDNNTPLNINNLRSMWSFSFNIYKKSMVIYIIKTK